MNFTTALHPAVSCQKIFQGSRSGKSKGVAMKLVRIFQHQRFGLRQKILVCFGSCFRPVFAKTGLKQEH